MTTSIQKLLDRALFDSGIENAYAILDGAAMPGLLARLANDAGEFECLFRGELEPGMKEVSPYVTQLERGSEFFEWLVERGWGRHFGIFALSNADLATLHRRLRRLTLAEREGGRTTLFRFYDPRVLRRLMPTMDNAQLVQFFGPIQRYVMEPEHAERAALQFDFDGNALQYRTLALDIRPAHERLAAAEIS
ncbi:MAG: DUF4123 domain-containing protein [Gammaproteobacteria bacterium]